MLDSTFVAQHIVHALGLRPIADQPALELLIGFLRPKQILLVLDNCEHLNEACAQLAWQLLIEAPELHILATSREPLGFEGKLVTPYPAWPGPLPAES